MGLGELFRCLAIPWEGDDALEGIFQCVSCIGDMAEILEEVGVRVEQVLAVSPESSEVEAASSRPAYLICVECEVSVQEGIKGSISWGSSGGSLPVLEVRIELESVGLVMGEVFGLGRED